VAQRFSVIVPARDCAASLRRCLDALAQSDRGDFECIVVDDGSSPPLRIDDAPLPVRLIRLEPSGGPARARNRGAAVATGAILVFFDADVCPQADTLRRFDAWFVNDARIAAVIGSYDRAPDDPGFVSQYKNLFHHFVHQHSNRNAATFWGACGAMRAEIFHRFGGFDESYARPSIEDIELGYRLRRAGHAIVLDPTIQVTHLKRWTLRTLLRSDLLDRALPWLRLMLRDRRMPSDLNTTTVPRLSVVLVWGLTALLAATVLTGLPHGLPLAALPASILLWLNRHLYRFFAHERGVRFTLGAVPLHWLYYFYCGVAVVLAVVVYLPEVVVRPPAAPTPTTGKPR
jgi:GT2 family glycosyltransferase